MIVSAGDCIKRLWKDFKFCHPTMISMTVDDEIIKNDLSQHLNDFDNHTGLYMRAMAFCRNDSGMRARNKILVACRFQF